MQIFSARPILRYLLLVGGLTGLITLVGVSSEVASRNYHAAPDAPRGQSAEAAQAKSAGCIGCHTSTDAKSMHLNTAVQLGCTDCHGGNAGVTLPAGAGRGSRGYMAAQEAAHVLPRYPADWHYPSSANPERTYTLLNRENPEFIRFINPSDYRVVREACGACHLEVIEAAVRSMHATGAMLWGGAAYNNGILDNKSYNLGESYDREGRATILAGPLLPDDKLAAARDAAILPRVYPLPAWETVKPGDIFRVFEPGGRNISSLFPETALPNSTGQLQRLEEPGKPDVHQSNRGPGTGARIAVPLINITKTRLNDPLTWFMGTNDQPGDYRNSGCSSCHVVYANDRDPRHSGPYAAFGHMGRTQTADPTIAKSESGHPLQHAFTRAMPTSQCMVCHMHQPNMFMNTFLGYTMWDYEADAPRMWPEKQQYPDDATTRAVLDRNPEAAATRGKWGNVEFLANLSSLNPTMKDTQFADYHGHGWNFRAVYKRDRQGNLLDAGNKVVADNDPEKFGKAVHLSSVHVDVGMHCVDCHFSQDNHGDGHIHGEVASAVEVDCRDCHGTTGQYPTLYTSGANALGGGTDMSVMRTPDGRRRFEWKSGQLYQRSMLNPELEWRMSLVKDSVTRGNAHYNEKAARAKLMGTNTRTLEWGSTAKAAQLAHPDDKVECYTCHTSWTTSCSGCHLPIEANAKTARHHYEGGETRNFATYNPQVARDDIFMLGKRETAAGGRVAPVRSSSALMLSSTNSSREKIYTQQPPISASGYSSQAFAPHYPHTERKTETKTCDDCHLSQAGDNNAIMAQLLGLGTGYVNFVGYHAFVGGAGEVSAITVTEWDEPQAVIGSYLQRYAYPDWYKRHQDKGQRLQEGFNHGAGTASCLQLRGEYLYVAEGSRGVRVYDVAGVSNKGISQRILGGPFSLLGHDTQVASRNATCIALPSNQPIDPARNDGDLMRVANQEQPMHAQYSYAFVTDEKEGLILININTLADGEPRNNYLKRALTWNPDGILNGARHLTIGGNFIYVTTPGGLVIVDIANPLRPAVAARLALKDPRATALQFRFLFVTTAEGLRVVNVTRPAAPKLADGMIAIRDAHRVYVARTYAYIAAGAEGIVIVDVERPEAMREYRRFNADGKLKDSRDVVVASTNASAFAYVADGAGGLKVLQLTSPESQPKFYGFSPAPVPQLIAWYPTGKEALALSRGLDRDRAVDESGNQIAVFGRRGSRPFNFVEMGKLFLDANGEAWTVPGSQRMSAQP